MWELKGQIRKYECTEMSETEEVLNDKTGDNQFRDINSVNGCTMISLWLVLIVVKCYDTHIDDMK